MTLTRDGWLAGRPVAVIRDDRGRELKFVCLKCEAEIEADRDVFIQHSCENYREGPKVELTDAARELADAHDLDVDEIEGSGDGGRIIKADVESAVEDS